MSRLFVCNCCGCVDSLDLAPAPNGQWLCSLCNPLTRKWHGQFPREPYDEKNDIVCNRQTGLGLS
jgi:hypothetical protein